MSTHPEYHELHGTSDFLGLGPAKTEIVTVLTDTYLMNPKALHRLFVY